MTNPKFLSTNFAALLVYGRPPMVFAGMLCAINVMLDRNPYVYYSGVIFLLAAMTLDLIDGWFAARFRPHAKLSHLADRIMDKIVYAMVFPMVAVGMMWRYQTLAESANFRLEMLHVVFVFVLCVTVLMRDNFAHFMRNFSLRKGEEEEMKELDELTKTQLEIAIRKANEKHKDFEIDDSLVSIFIKMIGKRREGEQITPNTSSYSSGSTVSSR